VDNEDPGAAYEWWLTTFQARARAQRQVAALRVSAARRGLLSVACDTWSDSPVTSLCSACCTRRMLC